jgi:hypothetical protein
MAKPGLVGGGVVELPKKAMGAGAAMWRTLVAVWSALGVKREGGKRWGSAPQV